MFENAKQKAKEKAKEAAKKAAGYKTVQMSKDPRLSGRTLRSGNQHGI